MFSVLTSNLVINESFITNSGINFSFENENMIESQVNIKKKENVHKFISFTVLEHDTSLRNLNVTY